MRSIVINTYYQLLHAIAFTLNDLKPAKIFIGTQYQDFNDDRIARIKSTGIFEDVISFEEKGDFKDFFEAMGQMIDKSEEEIDAIGSSIFEQYLTPYYKEIFKEADLNDEIFIYNDFQWFFYYIANNFLNITAIEDGYGSITQQFAAHEGKVAATSKSYASKSRFLGRYYPEPLFKSENIRKVISSRDVPNAPDYLSEKLMVLDFVALRNAKREAFMEVLKTIFSMDSLPDLSGGLLLIAQPLSARGLCSITEEYLLDQRMVDDYKISGKPVIIKPHPAQKLDLRIFESETDRVTVLDGNFPVEILNYSGAHFDRVVTFGSTAIETVDCADEKIRVSGSMDASFHAIKEQIATYTEKERISVGIYMPTSKKYKISEGHVQTSIMEGLCHHVNVDIYALDGMGCEDEAVLLDRISENRGHTFLLFLEKSYPLPLLHKILGSIIKELNLETKLVLFNEYVESGFNQIPLRNMRVGSRISPQITNRIYRRDCLMALGSPVTEDDASRIMKMYDGKITHWKQLWLLRDLRHINKPSDSALVENSKLICKMLKTAHIDESDAVDRFILICYSFVTSILVHERSTWGKSKVVYEFLSETIRLFLSDGQISDSKNHEKLHRLSKGIEQYLLYPPIVVTAYTSTPKKAYNMISRGKRKIDIKIKSIIRIRNSGMNERKASCEK